MITSIHETVEVMDGGLLQIHAPRLRPKTMVNVIAVIEEAKPSTKNKKIVAQTKGLIANLAPDAIEVQRKLRNEWGERFGRESK